MQTDYKKLSAAKCVKSVIDELPDGYEFFGNELKKMCVKKNPALKDVYIETFLKTMRKLRRSVVVCVGHNRSLYRIHKEADK